MDELLRVWAFEFHGPGLRRPEGVGCGNVIALLMDTQGELIRSTNRGGSVLVGQAAEIEMIMNRHLLPHKLERVVREHYLNRQSLEYQKWAFCRCSRATFYRRLNEAQAALQGMLIRRAA
ncbi:hypothetical protein ACQCLI_13025 [Pseudomonas nitroreducens]|uniref:PA0613 family protein n=1 Tax=Pseudomonas nitroreducens TaxID=46680 RepID=UPI001F356FB7|nr:hypothetical protein [Pseudomonas nitroreducens]